MSYFKSNPPEETPFFNPENGTHPSLSEYISRRLETATAGPSASTPATSFVSSRKAGAESREDSTSSPGQFLNSLDVDLTAGLEQYLPTPVFRLRVVKKRLDAEIEDLEGRLNKYEKLPGKSPEMLSRMEAVQERLALLQAHQQEISRELSAMLRFGPFFYRIAQMLHGMSRLLVPRAANPWKWLGRLIYGKNYETLDASRQELNNLQAVLAESLNDRTVSQAEISRILNRYEQTLRRSETAALGLKPVSPLQRFRPGT